MLVGMVSLSSVIVPVAPTMLRFCHPPWKIPPRASYPLSLSPLTRLRSCKQRLASLPHTAALPWLSPSLLVLLIICRQWPLTCRRATLCLLTLYLKINLTMVRFLTLNVNGLRDVNKRMSLLQWLSHLSTDFVCLQGVHATSCAEASSWFAPYGFLVVSAPGNPHSGGSVILYRSNVVLSNSWVSANGRFLIIWPSRDFLMLVAWSTSGVILTPRVLRSLG